MSGAVTPISPKAANAELPGAERKYAETPAATKPAVDTIDAGAKGSSEGVLACLQSLACSVWSCLAGFFSWIGSLFGPAPRDNAELLANPLKHIAAGLEAWENPKGPMTQLLSELRKYSTVTTVEFQFIFSASEKVSSASWQYFLYEVCGPVSKDIRTLNDPNELRKFTGEFIGTLLQSAAHKLKSEKLYIDLDREDQANILLRVKLATPVVESPEESTAKIINIIHVSQHIEKEDRNNKPRLNTYLLGNFNDKE